MKTSLNIDDFIFAEAKKTATETNQTISDVISRWASIGREKYLQKKKKTFSPVSLGGSKIDLGQRNEWLELLE